MILKNAETYIIQGILRLVCSTKACSAASFFDKIRRYFSFDNNRIIAKTNPFENAWLKLRK